MAHCVDMNVPVRFALADALSVVLPSLPDSLSSPQARPSLLRLADCLPPIPRVLLECRLREAAQVDLSIGITDSEFDKALLPKYFASDGSQRWNRVARFVEWWCEENDSRLKSAWLEFDVVQDFDSLPLPSVFLHLRASPVQPCTAESTGAAAALECLQPGAAERLDRWLKTLPPQAVPTYVGVMLSRSQGALRLNVAGLSPEGAWTWLARHGTPYPEFRALFEQAYRLGGSTILAVDIDDAVGSRVGLECRPPSDTDTRAMFEVLSANKLCTDSAYQSLRNWTGYISAVEKGADWPVYLAIEAMLRKNVGTSVLLRRINHVKLVFDEGGLTDAKIYLAFDHAVYSRDELQARDGNGAAQDDDGVGMFTQSDIRSQDAELLPELAAAREVRQP